MLPTSKGGHRQRKAEGTIKSRNYIVLSQPGISQVPGIFAPKNRKVVYNMANIQQRGNSYRIRVFCGTDSKGKKIMKSTTFTPDEGMTPRQIEKALNKAVVEFEERALSTQYIDNSKLKLSDFCPQYLRNVKSKLAPTTYAKYQRIIEVYIIPALGHLKIQDVRPIHVQKFVNALSEDNVRQDGKGDRLAPSTIHRYYTVLQSILHNAYSLELISSNPADSAKIELPVQLEGETEIYTKNQAKDMLLCLEDEPIMYQALIHLAITSGARRGELVGLKWEDIDCVNNTISIKRSNYQLKGERVQSKSTKSGKERVIVIPKYCVDLLKAHRASQAEKRLAIGDQWMDEGWIFTQWNGMPMYPTSPSQWFAKFQKRHGLLHKKFHALRHSSATLLLGNGTNIKNVAYRLGHAKLSTTNRYVHAIEEVDREAANTFDLMFSREKKA